MIKKFPIAPVTGLLVVGVPASAADEHHTADDAEYRVIRDRIGVRSRT